MASKQNIIDEIADRINYAVSNTGTLTDSEIKAAFNAALTAMNTVDPSKKPTVKHIIDLEF